MSSERIKVERKIKDCGNGWCKRCEAGRGHIIQYRYNSVVGISTITLDGEDIVIAPDNVVDAIADLVVEGNKGAVK